MNLVLEREVLTDQSTIGRLMLDGELFCYTLEDVVRVTGSAKVAGKTAIPEGTYRTEITVSNRFKKALPILQGVVGFTGIRIHAGNTSADTEGCILIGMTKGDNVIGKSQMAMSLFLPKLEEGLKHGEVWLEVRNP